MRRVKLPPPAEWFLRGFFLAAGAAFIARVGKKAAGRLLDGALHDGYPGGVRD